MSGYGGSRMGEHGPFQLLARQLALWALRRKGQALWAQQGFLINEIADVAGRPDTVRSLGG